MPLQATSGAASYDAFGGGVPVVPNYIEDVFSTYLYTGNGSTQNIVNGINLSDAFGKGGLTWIKSRSAATNNFLFDTDRGTEGEINSNTTDAQASLANSLTSFNTDGFSVGSATGINVNAATYASWTFRRQPKYFDIVYYSGTGSNRTIAHNLGSVPGCIIIKSTDTVTNWAVYHRGLANTEYLVLNSTAAQATGATWWNSTTPTSSVFSVGTNSTVNASGSSYIAYVFAHDAGGFGLTGTDNVITCGSFEVPSSGSAIDVNLGYEPQWILVKNATGTSTSYWQIVDNARGWTADGATVTSRTLKPNTADAETNPGSLALTSTGFQYFRTVYSPGDIVIYVAIRRGPMKVPTSGTSVFGLSARTGTGANETVTGGQTDDAVIIKNRGSAVASLFSSRLTNTGYLVTSTTAAEVAAGTTILQANPWDVMDGVKVGTTSTITNASANTYINYLFKRAPSFMDVVAYTGTGTSSATQTHNLGVVPELIILKCRTITYIWYVFSAYATGSDCLLLDRDFAWSGYGNPARTSTTFTVTAGTESNDSGATYVAYLFATCAGVSKVFSYTGNGSSQTINCGFTGGARFVLIKRTDDVGDWYVWDSARGIVAGNDPHLSLNSTAAEVTTDDSVDTDNTGFIVNQLSATNVNVTSATYIGIAIA